MSEREKVDLERLRQDLEELDRLLIEAAAKVKGMRAYLPPKVERENAPTEKQVRYALYLAGRTGQPLTEEQLRGMSFADVSEKIDEMLELLKKKEEKRK